MNGPTYLVSRSLRNFHEVSYKRRRLAESCTERERETRIVTSSTVAQHSSVYSDRYVSLESHGGAKPPPVRERNSCRILDIVKKPAAFSFAFTVVQSLGRVLRFVDLPKSIVAYFRQSFYMDRTRNSCRRDCSTVVASKFDPVQVQSSRRFVHFNRNEEDNAVSVRMRIVCATCLRIYVSLIVASDSVGGSEAPDVARDGLGT